MWKVNDWLQLKWIMVDKWLQLTKGNQTPKTRQNLDKKVISKWYHNSDQTPKNEMKPRKWKLYDMYIYRKKVLKMHNLRLNHVPG